MVKKIALALVVVIAGGVIYLYLFPDDRKVIEKRFDRLALKIEMTEAESVLGMASKANAASEFFAEECSFQTHRSELKGTISRRELAQRIGRMRAQARSIHLVYDQVDIEVLSKTEAEARISATLRAEMKSMSDLDESHLVLFTLEKIDGSWLITAMDILDEG